MVIVQNQLQGSKVEERAACHAHNVHKGENTTKFMMMNNSEVSENRLNMIAVYHFDVLVSHYITVYVLIFASIKFRCSGR